MKKFIALLLALVLAFSVTAVAFAADGNAATGITAQSDERTFGDLGMTEDEIIDFVMNLPAGSVFQGAKLALKFAKFAVKIALALDRVHLIDLSPLKNAILEMVADLIKDYVKGQQPEDPEVPEEIAEIVEAYNNAVAKTKATGNMTVKKTSDVQIELTDCSVPMMKNVISGIIEKFTGATENTWTFSGGKGTNEGGEITTADKLIPPANRAATLSGINVASVSSAPSGDGYTMVITLNSEVSLFDGEYTLYPAGNHSVMDPLDFSTFDAAPITVKEAEITYSATVLEATVDSFGRLTQLHVKAPVTVSGLCALPMGSSPTSFAVAFEGALDDTYTFTY